VGLSRGPTLGQHLCEGELGLLHATGQPVGHGQQVAGPQARPDLPLGEVRHRRPGEPGRLLRVSSDGGKLGAHQRGGRRYPRDHAPLGRQLGLLGVGLAVDGAVGVPQQPLGRVRPAAVHLQQGLGQDKARARPHHLGGQGLQVAPERDPLPPAEGLVQVPLHQPRRPGGVVGGQGVPDRVVDQPVRLAPGGRGAVQLDHSLGLLLGEADAEQVGEQVVVAPPAAHLIQRQQEQVRPLDALQQLLAVGAAGDCVAQRPTQPLQHRGLQQELAHLFRLAFQQLLAQVVQDVPMAAGELFHEGLGVGALPQRQGGQLQPHRPPFGAGLHGGDHLRRQVEPPHLAQERRRLLVGEPQVGGAQLDQLARGTKPRQRQRRVAAAGDHQMQPRRQVAQQEGHAVVDRPRIQQVVVVDHQRKLRARRLQLAEQGGHHPLAGQATRSGQLRQHLLGEAAARAVQRRDHIPPEACRVVVQGVQRQPGNREVRAGGPVGQQSGLAEAGGRAHQDQLPGHALVEPLQQPRAGQAVRTNPRDGELAGQQVIPRSGRGLVWRRDRRLGHRTTAARAARTTFGADSTAWRRSLRLPQDNPTGCSTFARCLARSPP